MAEEFVRRNGLLELIKIPRCGEINLVAVLIIAHYRYNVSPLSVHRFTNTLRENMMKIKQRVTENMERHP